MKFVNIDIQNFMAIGKSSLSLDKRGLLLVQGENKDDTSQNSNGAGKSSIVDALCWCLYGQTARDETGDTVINRKAGKNCKVTVTLNDDGDEYTVTRHRKFTKKKNVLELVKNGTDDLTQGTDKLTQERVEQILGCSYDVFRSSVYAGQDAQIDLPNMTDKFLKQIVEEAAGIDRLQAAHELAKQKRNEVKASRAEIDKLTFASQMALEELDFHEKEAQAAIDKYEEQRQQELDKLDFRIKNAKTKAQAIVKQIRGIPINDIQSEYEDLINTAVSEAWQQERDKLTAEIDKSDKACQAEQRALDTLKGELQKAKDKINQSEALVGQPCDECGKPYTQDDVKDVLTKARQFFADNMPKAKALKATILDLEKTLSEQRAALKAHEQSVMLTDEKKTRRDALAAQKEEHAQLLTQARSMKQSITDDMTRRDEAQAAANPHQATLDKVHERIANEKNTLDTHDDRVKAADKALAIADGVVEVYSNTGVRAHILDTVTPFLNTRTAEYLGQLSDGNIEAVWNTLSTTAKGELREKFTIDVRSKTGGSSYKGLSGGEKRKVRLATNMALQDLVSSRASKPIDLYIGDEIDHALDVSGLERLMALLEEKAKHQGTVLVVSHNELSDWIRETITVVKKDGYSTIEE
jgi:DNA repair exonuclease SbcCD ATPase subunit